MVDVVNAVNARTFKKSPGLFERRVGKNGAKRIEWCHACLSRSLFCIHNVSVLLHGYITRMLTECNCSRPHRLDMACKPYFKTRMGFQARETQNHASNISGSSREILVWIITKLCVYMFVCFFILKELQVSNNLSTSSSRMG